MPGRTTGDNAFGPSPFVVGPILGDGVNYDTIQSAINDAAAVGGGKVLIHPGTYVEDLTLDGTVNLIGVDVSGIFGDVIISGSHTYTGAGNLRFQNIKFIPNVFLYIFQLTAAAPFLLLGFDNCEIDATTLMGCSGVEVLAGANFTIILSDSSRIRADLFCFDLLGPVQMVFRGTANSINANVIRTASTWSIRYEHSYAQSDNDRAFTLSGTGLFYCNHCQITSQEEAFSIDPGVTVENTNTNISTTSGSGYYVAGTGSYTYADVSINGPNVIDPGLTVATFDWKPYAPSVPAPGTGETRGTSCFDDSQFTVTDGFVQFTGTAVPTTLTTDSGTATPAANNINILGGTGSLITAAGDTVTVNSPLWSVVGATTAVTENTGSILNAVPGSVFTLPTGVPDGKVVELYSANNGSKIIQCIGGDIIRFGNLSTSVNGTATSDLAGDWLRLVYFNAANQWLAAGIVGNWTLA